jgi:phage terminase large subunit-like protein
MKVATRPRHTKNKGGRPPVKEAMKLLRGTSQPCRRRGRKKNSPGGNVSTRKDNSSARDYVAIASSYVADVLAGRIVAGTWTIRACQRFQRFCTRAQSDPACPYTFSREHAQRVCAFVERLPHVEGHWSSPTLQLEPWQAWILVSCYGFRLRSTGRRLTTVVFFEVGRKSAKSTLVAAAALYHLLEERNIGSQVVLAASTGQQARIVFEIMRRMVQRAPWLRDAGLRTFVNAITYEATGSNARPINSKSETQDGLNPSFISLDESHAQDFALRDVLVSAMGARPDGMVWSPTTAGFSLTSVGYALREHAMQILDGVVESDHTFCVLYECDEGDQWDDERNWIKACPMIGVTPTLEFVRRYCTDAQQAPGLQGEFQTKVCNWWLQSSSSWLSMPAWQQCADSSLTLEQFAGQPCWIGADLASLDDLAAVALLFKRDDGLIGFVRCYLPARVVEARSRAVPEYRHWARDGILTLTDGNMTDFGRVETDLRGWCRQFQVRDLVFDQYSSAQITSNLFNSGLPARVEPKNPKTFTPAARELEARVLAGLFRHDGNSCLTWQASNCVVNRRYEDSLMPTKVQAESPRKIDAIDALLLAIGGYLRVVNAPVPQYQMVVFG